MPDQSTPTSHEQDPQEEENGSQQQPQRSTHRKLAEWVTLSISILLILACAAGLAVEAVRGNDNFVPLRATAQSDQAQQTGDHYTLPVTVENPSPRTLKDVRVRVSYDTPGQGQLQQTVLIDYLPAESKQTVYVVLEQPPGPAHLKVTPLQYSLD